MKSNNNRFVFTSCFIIMTWYVYCPESQFILSFIKTLMIESWVNLFTMFTLYTMYTIDSDAVKIVVQYLKYNYKKSKRTTT